MQNSTSTLDELHDQADLITLVKVIFKQAIDDYIKLRHPAWGKKKELKDALITATEFLFDDEYRSKVIKTDEDEPATLKYLLNFITYVNKEKLEEIRQNIINETVDFWSQVQLTTIVIPEVLVFKGFTWLIVDKDIPEPIVKFDDKLIIMNTKQTEKNQYAFLNACLQIISYENNTMFSKELLDGLWETMRMNSCFSGHI